MKDESELAASSGVTFVLHPLKRQADSLPYVLGNNSRSGG